jgi:hypothetical protein
LKDSDALQVRRGHRIENEDEDEGGDVDRLVVGGHVEDVSEGFVGDPAGDEDDDRGEGEGGRVVRNDVEEAQHKGDAHQRQQVVKHQPVDGDVVEDFVDGLHHGSEKLAKPLVSVARPSALIT